MGYENKEWGLAIRGRTLREKSNYTKRESDCEVKGRV